MAKTMTDSEAREVLGLDEEKWTIQLTDEELRMLQDILRAEARRKASVFDALQEKLEGFDL